MKTGMQMGNGVQLTLWDLNPLMCQEQTVGVLDSHAKTCQLGGRKGLSGERSSLVREIFRLLKGLSESDKPEWLVCENVMGMLSSFRGIDFLEILLEMESCGYDIEWQVCNSRCFRVPQNRERVYTVGHNRSYGRRKVFPVTGTDGKTDIHASGIEVPIREAVSKGYSMAREGDCINFAMPNSKTRRGRVGHGVAQCLTTSCSQGILVIGHETQSVLYDGQKVAIRRLTPKECFRLQGWSDEYFERAEMLQSDVKLYQQAGNGITVNVMYEIGKKLCLTQKIEKEEAPLAIRVKPTGAAFDK